MAVDTLWGVTRTVNLSIKGMCRCRLGACGRACMAIGMVVFRLCLGFVRRHLRELELDDRHAACPSRGNSSRPMIGSCSPLSVRPFEKSQIETLIDDLGDPLSLMVGIMRRPVVIADGLRLRPASKGLQCACWCLASP